MSEYEMGKKDAREEDEAKVLALGEKVAYYTWSWQKDMQSWEIHITPRVGTFKIHILKHTQSECVERALVLLKKESEDG